MKKPFLLLSALILLFVGAFALTAKHYKQQYYAIIPDTEKTYQGTIIDCAMYPHEINAWYSIARSQIGIALDNCETCSVCYDHYFTVSKHCTDAYDLGDSVILTVAQERGTGQDVVIRITPAEP